MLLTLYFKYKRNTITFPIKVLPHEWNLQFFVTPLLHRIPNKFLNKFCSSRLHPLSEFPVPSGWVNMDN